MRPPASHKLTKRVDRRQTVLGRKRDQKIAVGERRDVRWQKQTAVPCTREGVKKTFNVGGILDWAGNKLDRKRRRRDIRRVQKEAIDNALRIGDESGASKMRRDFLEKR